jgi:hypothetical protein
MLGEHIPAASIDREDCRRVRQMLEDLPPNYTKLPATRGLSMEEAARVSRELDLPWRKPESVNSYLNNLATLMNYAENEGLIPKSPARGLAVTHCKSAILLDVRLIPTPSARYPFATVCER